MPCSAIDCATDPANCMMPCDMGKCEECHRNQHHHDHHEEEKDCKQTCEVKVNGMDMNCEDGCRGCFEFPMGRCEEWCYEDLCRVNGCAACHGLPEDMSMDDMINHA